MLKARIAVNVSKKGTKDGMIVYCCSNDAASSLWLFTVSSKRLVPFLASADEC